MNIERPESDELKRLYIDRGHTVAEIAVRLGIAHGTAHNWLRGAGIELRPSPATTRGALSDDPIRELYIAAGLSAAHVARHAGGHAQPMAGCRR